MTAQLMSAEVTEQTPRLLVIEPNNAQQPPEQIGRFLISGRTYSREDDTGFPIDYATDVPLPVLAVGTLRSFEPGSKTNHHHANYSRTDPNLEGKLRLEGSGSMAKYPENLSLEKLGGLAVRVSRTQRMPLELHAIAHKRYPKGPQLPTTNGAKFRRAVNQLAGVVSRYAVDVTNPDPDNLVYMNTYVFDQITEPWNLHPEQYAYNRPEGYQANVLGTFFLRYALEQDLGHVSMKVVNEFLYSSNRRRRVVLGACILREGLEASIAPIISVHKILRAEGMIQKDGTDTREAILGTVSLPVIKRVTPILLKKLAA